MKKLSNVYPSQFVMLKNGDVSKWLLDQKNLLMKLGNLAVVLKVRLGLIDRSDADGFNV